MDPLLHRRTHSYSHPPHRENSSRAAAAAIVIRGAVLFLLPLLMLVTVGCTGNRDGETAATTVVGERSALSVLSTSDTAGFARADVVRDFRFPEDDGPHPEFRTEWWYWTGNLESSDGRRFGYQLTFFRQALAPGVRDSAWRSGHTYFANFALTDIDGGQFHAFERFNRGTAGLAGARAFPFRVWVDDWTVHATGANDITGPVELRATEGEISIALTLRAEKPRILHGDHGLSKKSAASGNASYYYSLTRIASDGHIRIGDRTFAVQGTSWLDREWSTSVLDPAQTGWDWFSMQFDDGSELMLYQLRLDNGGIDPFSAGSSIDPTGKRRTLTREEFHIMPRGAWQSPRSGIHWPSGWEVRIPALGLVLDVEPVRDDQELPLTVTYWEGAVRIRGSRTGVGYVELTGY
ncbi:MAG: lipocalin-like domain-containing protein [Bacteroidota bacterium]|jgi:predicted secreted hydrolase|nr:lipocalin-like domain-containing protein [Bacteroidota bacterium]